MSMASTYSGDRSIKSKIFDMSWDPRTPWNALPPLPPPRDEVETISILRACIPARAALAELKKATELLPDPSLLTNLLPLLEAQASSEIENIVTNNDKLFRFADDLEHADSATKEALRYRAALRFGVERLKKRPLSGNDAAEICSVIKGARMEVRTVPGTVLGNPRTGEVVYTPPSSNERLRDLLANWERFLHEDEALDPLIKMAIAHYQFEAIHPFIDGNGRTGRVINLLFLIDQGLLHEPTLHLSRYLLRRRADYYRLLLGVTRDGAWEEWVLFMLDAVAETAAWTNAKIDAIRALFAETRAYIERSLPQLGRYELIELIFRQPYCRIGHLVDAGIAQRQTASAHLKRLVEIGVLEELSVGREKLFLHPRLIDLMGSEEHAFTPYR